MQNKKLAINMTNSQVRIEDLDKKEYRIFTVEEFIEMFKSYEKK